MLRILTMAFVLVTVFAISTIASAEGIGQSPDSGAKTDLEVRQHELDVWDKLPASTRRVIAQRAKHFYQFGDIYVDTYLMMHLQSELKTNIATTSVRRSRGNFSKSEEVSRTLSYRDDPELTAFLSLPGYPCVYWKDGLVLNRQDLWATPEYEPLRVAMGIENIEERDFFAAMSRELHAAIPVIVANDPISHQANRDDLFDVTGSVLQIKNATIGSLTSLATDLVHAGNPNRAVSWQPNGTFQIRPGRFVQDGLPNRSLFTFALIPSKIDNIPSIAPQNAISRTLEYEVADLRAFQMTAREVAVAFVDGKLEIPYREIKKESGIYRCTESLLTR